MIGPDPLGGFDAAAHGLGSVETLARIRRGMWLLATLPRPPVGQTPHRVIHTQDKLALRFYAPDRDEGLPPVIVVPSLINRAYICDLEPDRSLVGALARAGHPVYLVDWGIPGPEDADEGVAYVIDELLRRAVTRACRHAGAPAATLLGYCQGGTLAAMFTALHPAPVRGLIALATPVAFAQGGRFTRFAASTHPAAIVGPDGLVDVAVLKIAFRMLDPMGSWSKHLAVDAATRDPRRLARVLARERWLEDNVPMAGRFAVEFLEAAYRRDALLAEAWSVGSRIVRLGDIRCPVLVNPCRRDFIAPLPSAEPLASAVGSDDVTLAVLDAGHIGCIVGGHGPAHYFPMLDRWLRARSAPAGRRRP